MPRTTVDIQTPILKELKKLQAREKRSLGSLVSELLAEALAQRASEPAKRSLDWHSQSMQARVDLEDKEAVWATLDGHH